MLILIIDSADRVKQLNQHYFQPNDVFLVCLVFFSHVAPHSGFSSHDASESQTSGAAVMSRLSQFIPAMHHALLKVRANPPPELSAGVERQAREYLIGLKDGKVRPKSLETGSFKYPLPLGTVTFLCLLPRFDSTQWVSTIPRWMTRKSQLLLPYTIG